MSGVDATAAGSYQRLRGHLAYLKLTRAEELLAAHLETARAQHLSHVAFLEALLGEEVTATRRHRHRARLRCLEPAIASCGLLALEILPVGKAVKAVKGLSTVLPRLLKAAKAGRTAEHAG